MKLNQKIKMKPLSTATLPTVTFLATFMFSMLSYAVETGTALKNDQIRTEPYADAKVSGSFSRGDTLEILAKKGAWLNIKTKKNSGWVRLLSVKRGTSSGSSSSGSDALKVASGRAGTGKVVATTGVRGLSAEELKSAKFSETEIKALESYTLTEQQGQQFANNGGLKANHFAMLKEAKGAK